MLPESPAPSHSLRERSEGKRRGPGAGVTTWEECRSGRWQRELPRYKAGHFPCPWEKIFYGEFDSRRRKRPLPGRFGASREVRACVGVPNSGKLKPMSAPKIPPPKTHKADAAKSPPDESPMKKCVICRKEIPAGAKICTECDCYQDWRRYFGLSSTVLSLLVALFSVLTVGVPVIYDALTPKRSAVHCNLISWDENTGDVKIVVSNEGVRPAVIKSLMLVPKGSETLSPIGFQSDFSEPVLEPGKFRTLAFHGVIGSVRTTKLQSVTDLRSKHELKLMIFPFAGESSEVRCENWVTFQ
jgi:predicted nucleic acid-binding Zn ribbon protein